MTTSEKKKAYLQLVADVKSCGRLSDCNSGTGKKNVMLEKCSDCE